MGINFSHLGFYDLCHERGALLSPLLALGSQEIHEPKEQILGLAARHSYAELARDASVRSLFHDRYAVSEYRDADLNEQADMRLDLNLPLAAELIGRFGTVLNAGTIEHAFNISQAFENIHRLVRTGGSIVHVAPLSWYNHGYYNFDRRIFTAVGEANRYRLLAEAFLMDDDRLRDRAGTGAALYVTHDGVSCTPWHDRIAAVLGGAHIPARALYMAAYRKTTAAEFTMPYDIQP